MEEKNGILFPEATKLDDTVPEDRRQFYMRFYIGPIQKGFGHTLGNSLRRVLLSSIEGSAIVGVRIPGISHEFESIEGVKEEVTQIILALKKIRLKLKSSEPLAWCKISVENKSKDSSLIVTAGDIEGPVEIVNPAQYIAELAPEAKLTCDLAVAKGRGYVAAETIKQEFDLPADVIPIDGIFNPIIKVNYEVRRAMHGGRADYDELVLDVWTDGTIDPISAYEEAIDILQEFYNRLLNYKERGEVERRKEEIKVGLEELLKKDIVELNIAQKVVDILKKHGITTVEQLIRKTDKELLALENFGRRSLREVKEALKNAGLTLGMTDEDIQKAIEESKREGR